jgi:hypothetical protein
MPTPVLIVNPRDDLGFTALAEQLVAEGIDAATVLEARLRERYPAVAVRPRALSSEPLIVWYVYRDGHWVPSMRREED